MKIIYNKIWVSVGLILLPILTWAQSSAGPGTGVIPNPLAGGITSLPELLKLVLNAVVQIGTVVVIMAIIYSGFLYVAARGNEDKLKKARTAITGTLIGAAIILGAYVISYAIQNTINQLKTGTGISYVNGQNLEIKNNLN